MRIHTKILLAMQAVVLITCISFSVIQYGHRRALLLAGIDSDLKTSARFAQALLPAGYHDRIVDENSIPPAEFEHIVQRFNSLCIEIGLQYLWSVLVVNGKVVFTSATSPRGESQRGDHARFFEVHSNPEAFRQAFDRMEPTFSSFENEWGRGRMVLIPGYDSNGRKFSFGASMSLNTVEQLLRHTLLNSVYITLGVLLLGAVFSIAVARSLSHPVVELTRIAHEIASGDLSPKINVGGSYEIRSLSESIEHMRAAIHEQMTELKESRENLATTLRSIGDAVITTDCDSLITGMNPVAERLTGWQEEEAIGQPIHEVFRVMNGRTREAGPNPVGRVLSEARVIDLMEDMLLVARDGTELLIGDSTAPIRNSRGGITGAVLVFHDETERRRLQEQLRRSQRMEAIGHLAGGVAHDFNNMLSSILGAADIIALRLPHRADITDMVDNIRLSVERASDLTQKLLIFSRQARIDSIPVEIHGLIRNAVLLLSRTIDPRISIRTELLAEWTTVIGDPVQLKNVILNLGINAREAMPEGGELVISTRNIDFSWSEDEIAAPEESGRRMMEISVSDSGIGMTPEVQEHIFEPFFTTKGIGKGTGLGLSAVYGAVKEHGGAIFVAGGPGKGSTFTIRLPASHSVHDSRSAAEIPLPENSRILLVDDEQAVRSATDALLQSLGFEVVSAEDGIRAVEIFREQHAQIHLVLLDIIMPGMDGLAALKAMRDINGSVAAVFMSGYSLDFTMNDMAASGAVGFIQKPFGREALARVLSSTLEKTRTVNPTALPEV